jgi:hypothetical protein
MELMDYVVAIADGALTLVTSKTNSPEKYCLWSKQKALSPIRSIPSYPLTTDHQAKKLDVTTRQLKKLGEDYIADTEARKKAAQILAEMLGLVCHREYFEIGEQMV